MKFTIEKSELLKALKALAGISPTGSHIPILEHVLIIADVDGSVTISANDTKVACSYTAEALGVDIGGEATANARLFLQLVELAPVGGIVELTLLENSVLTFRCGKSNAKMFSMTPEEFPPVSRLVSETGSFAVSSSVLQDAIKKANYAVCADTSRWNLCGVFFDLGETAHVVATDGRRLSVTKPDVEDYKTCKFNLPTRAIQFLTRVSYQDKETVIDIVDGRMTASAGPMWISAALIEGKYLDWSKVVPSKEGAMSLTVDTKQLIEALRRSLCLGRGGSPVTALSLCEGVLELKTEVANEGSITEHFVCGWEHEPFSIKFNPLFLLEPLNQIGEGAAEIRFKNAAAPMVVCAGGGDERFKNIIMPIRS